MPPIKRKMSILAYGQSGSGKTTQFKYFAKYVYDKYKLRSRFICWDGGSLWEAFQDLVDDGIVDVIQVPTAPEYNPFSTMRKLGRGEWPEGGRINLPTAVKTATGTQWKTNTKWLSWGNTESMEIGLIGTDSLTGMSSAYMFDAAAKNIRKGNESGGGVRDEEGEQYGSNTQSHYGDAQNEIKNYINAIVALPCPFSYFTALEDGGTENTTGVKRPVYGPQIAGSAATGELPKLVTNCFHLVAEGTGAAKTVKAYFDEHEDPTLPPKMRWKAKASSILPEQREDFVRAYPQGFIKLSLKDGLREFVEWKDRADEELRGKR